MWPKIFFSFLQLQGELQFGCYAHSIQTNLNLNAKFCFRISLCLQNSKYSCNKVAFSKYVLHPVLGLCEFHHCSERKFNCTTLDSDFFEKKLFPKTNNNSIILFIEYFLARDGPNPHYRHSAEALHMVRSSKSNFGFLLQTQAQKLQKVLDS